ncbi:M23 family metallopeptidase [Microbacterium sp. SD291]|nr:M23 family metallopeptidase [Microbacterium sp. SD291]
MLAAVLLAVLVTPAGDVAPAHAAASVAAGPTNADPATEEEHPVWEWPFAGARDVAVPYRAPAHEYGAGHRGVDVVASPDRSVRAPADGVVAFRGTVVDRPLLTIEHAGGYVSTFEPLSSTLSPGDVVSAGDVIGTVDAGGHAPSGTMHLGVRLDGDYINPMLMFGDVPRAILLPCCRPL